MIRVFYKSLKGGVAPAASVATRLSTRGAATQASFQTKPYKLHRLDTGPSTEVTLTKDDALKYYREMQVIRRMETAAGNLYKDKKVRGFCHLYSGEEACAVGMKMAMDPDDAVITSYRCHGWTYLSGGTVAHVLAELTGRMAGVVHGKGGSMHMYGNNFYGGNGIVGAQLPLGTGVAFAIKYRGKKNVCLTLYGDGAANQGQLFEATNMAKLWNLPVLFICENNGYAMGTAAARSSACTEYYTRGDYVPGIWVDGMDILAVRETIRFAKEWCNADKGPLMLEMVTYRYGGHSMSDPGTSYRTREEIQEVRKKRDPITGFKDKIITAGLVTEDQLKEVDKEVRKLVDEGVKIAQTDRVAPIETLYTDVYFNTPPQLIRCATTDSSLVQPYTLSAEAVKAAGKKQRSRCVARLVAVVVMSYQWCTCFAQVGFERHLVLGWGRRLACRNCCTVEGRVGVDVARDGAGCSTRTRRPSWLRPARPSKCLTTRRAATTTTSTSTVSPSSGAPGERALQSSFGMIGSRAAAWCTSGRPRPGKLRPGGTHRPLIPQQLLLSSDESGHVHNHYSVKTPAC